LVVLLEGLLDGEELGVVLEGEALNETGLQGLQEELVFGLVADAGADCDFGVIGLLLGLEEGLGVVVWVEAGVLALRSN
jgi:hypothetical protein